jgi:hypothetical protein
MYYSYSSLGRQHLTWLHAGQIHDSGASVGVVEELALVLPLPGAGTAAGARIGASHHPRLRGLRARTRLGLVSYIGIQDSEERDISLHAIRQSIKHLHWRQYAYLILLHIGQFLILPISTALLREVCHIYPNYGVPARNGRQGRMSVQRLPCVARRVCLCLCLCLRDRAYSCSAMRTSSVTGGRAAIVMILNKVLNLGNFRSLIK